jgi:hypothetical protein
VSVRIINVRPGGLAAALAAAGSQLEANVRKGLRSGARRSHSVLARVTPVDTGRLRAGYRVEDAPDGAELVNLTPYAAVVESHQHFVEGAMDEMRAATQAEVDRAVEGGS